MTRPSPALVISMLALVVALAGTALAGSRASSSAVSAKKVKRIVAKKIAGRLPWGGNDIAAGAVTGAKVADKSLTAADIDLGSLGLPSRIIVRQNVQTFNRTVGQSENVTASCRPGERATGGGASSESSVALDLMESHPVFATTSSPPTGWTAAFKWDMSGNRQIVAYAICELP